MILSIYHRISLFLLALSTASGSAVAADTLQSFNQPFELVVHRGDPIPDKCIFISLKQAQVHRKLSDEPSAVTHDLRPLYIDRTNNTKRAERIRIFSYDERVAWSRARSLCAGDILITQPSTQGFPTAIDSPQTILSAPHEVPHVGDVKVSAEPPSLQVERLIVSGPSHNRVDLVFFSDGYTDEEHDKFIEDATRLAKDVSGNQTFNTVQPLLNFWAAFAPSNESGIGVGGKPKDTPFGLYRDGTELRGVYYSKPETARAACLSLGDRCDYPILLGNDPLYGGLGGDFTVITSSLANGPLVLRHELGHSIIEVGEEYDGGFAYFGVNAADDLSQPVSWSHWLTDATESSDDLPRVELSVMPMQEYPWTMLDAFKPWSIKFNASGNYHRHLVRFSLSGIPAQSDLRVEIDGIDLNWTPQQDIGVDRWHYDAYRSGGLSGGEHEVKFILRNRSLEGQAQLCSVEILEFGDETEFVATPGYYGVFPTFSEENKTSYRPTNEDCLMRKVTMPNFCHVCLEGLWHSLLSRVRLIDDFLVGCDWTVDPDGAPSGHWLRTLETELVPLGQFREDGAVAGESYSIVWVKDGQVLREFTNQTRVVLDDEDALGMYSVHVKFWTDEVRVDTDGLLTSSLDYVVKEACGSKS